jgi:hypothetical protein
MLIYLGICAVVAFLAAAAAAFLGVPPAPTFHIAFAIGAMPLVFGAIIHFIPVLTRSGAPTASVAWLPLPLQAAGVLATLALGGWLPYASLHAAAAVAATAALALAVWIVVRMRRALGAPHPGARWYVAALLALLLAVAVVPFLLARPEWRAALRLFHLHLNTLGFIGMAALGTLPVLLPTALGRPEPTATARLRSDLWLAASGALLVAVGSASLAFLAAAGALLLGAVTLRNLLAWRRAYGWAAIVGDGGTAPLAAATLGLLWLLVFGLLHGAGMLPPAPAIAAWAGAFLLPLVTGALTQLLPVWRHPGADSPARRDMRGRLARWGWARALLFLAGGCLLALGMPAGGIPVAVALLLFGGVLIHALTAIPKGEAAGQGRRDWR